MGFFDSLLDGIGSVGGWLGNNAGNLLNAANAIAQAAGTFGLDEEALGEDSNIYPKMFSDMNIAQSNLYTFVQTVAKPPTSWKRPKSAPRSLSAFQAGLGGPFDMTGLWMNPGTVAAGMAPANVNSDIRKFLATNNLPLVLNDSLGNPMDVAQEIAQQMFATSQTTGPVTSTSFPNVLVHIDTPDYQIQGAHCYYSVPLGTDESTNGAWHAYLRLYKNSTTAFEQQRAVRAKQLTLKTKPMTFPPGSFVNTTIVTATWSGLTWSNDEIRTIMSNAANAMAAITSGGVQVYQLQGPWMASAGTTYNYTWVTALTLGSHDVLTTFTNEVNTAMNNATPSSAQQVPTGPSIEITYMQSGVMPSS